MPTVQRRVERSNHLRGRALPLSLPVHQCLGSLDGLGVCCALEVCYDG